MAHASGYVAAYAIAVALTTRVWPSFVAADLRAMIGSLRGRYEVEV
jgi:hypothetical protein